MAQTENTHSVRMGDWNVNAGNINSFNNTTIYKSEGDARIMRWLSPLEPGNRHDGVRSNRFEGVGDGFLKTSEFQHWREGEDGADKAVLFCSGNPGVGKTYLSSLVIDTLCDQAREGNLVVAWLYCDYLAQQEHTVTNIMGAILRQLVGRREIPKDILQAFQEGRRPLLPDLVRMLRVAIASLPQVFICIDGMDECLPKYLPELLESLRDIVREPPRTRIFLTGRPHVKEIIKRYFTKTVEIPISPNTNDIRNYVEMRLDRDDEPEAMDQDLRADIIKMILDKMSGIFLLASLNIEAILGEVTIVQRRKKLDLMVGGSGLSDAYTATLSRMKAQKGNRSRLGLRALMWVLCSERPLRAEELCHALGVEMGSAELDPKNIPSIRTLLASCLGLLTVEAFSSKVRLVHFTLQEHLLSDPTLFQSSHSTIAEVCLTYLNFGSVRELSPSLDSAPSTMPLLEYASFYWGQHAKKGMTEKVKILGRRFLDICSKHISIRLLELSSNRGLNQVTFFGIWDAIAAICETKEDDVNVADWMGSTALAKAAVGGQEAVVKMLLDREDVNPNSGNIGNGWTPLLLAAMAGREGVVKMLLEREDVNPDQSDTQYGQTPLSWAADNGHEGVVKMLLQREDVNPNQPDTKYGQTPLSWAAKNGHDGVVKMLLNREDVASDKPDIEYGQTPLSFAAENGHEGVVKILLTREDVNPDQTDTRYGQTPLSWAAMKGHVGVVKMLLEREDVIPDRPDSEYGQTPLSWAAKNGHECIVKMLLKREDVTSDKPDAKDGQTPLSWAAKNGHEGVVKILLEREEVNPNHANIGDGWTPLLLAAMAGREGVVKILLGREDINPDQSDTQYGQTPLSWAAESGHEGVVKILLGREDVNPDQPDTQYGQTPLSWAAMKGHEGVVKMLLEREDVNPDQPDTRYGRTPLSWAAKCGHEGVVKIFLERGDVYPAMPDNTNQNPLSLARSEGHPGVVRILQERSDRDSDKANHGGQASPPPSAGLANEFEVEMQFGSQDTNTDTTDPNGQPKPPPAAHGERARLPDLRDSISKSARLSWWARLLSIPLRKLFRRRRKT